MIAYNSNSLDNRIVEEQASEACVKDCISKEEYERIKAGYPSGLYTPNIYIRIGLFLLTAVIVSFSVGLLALLTMATSNKGVEVLQIFCGLVCYGALEYLVYSKKHFRSGVDDCLLWMAVILVFSGLTFLIEPGRLIGYMIIFVLSFGGWLRFADRVLALVAYAALLEYVFYFVSEFGPAGKAMLPFVVMAVAAAVYYISVLLYPKERYRHYRNSLFLIKAACLISSYLAGNYLVVREMSIIMYNLSMQPGDSIPLGWLFWVFTIAIPFLYIYRGVQKKDIVFLWVGLALIAATLFTIRHYYHILPLELAMVIGGIILIVIAYGLIRYLRIPRYGFTSAETDDRHFIESLHIESLVIAETFAPAPSPAGSDFQFGGGSGGGGGAGGQY